MTEFNDKWNAERAALKAQRSETVKMVKDIRTIRAMMIALNSMGYRHEHNKSERNQATNSRIGNLQEVLRDYRQEFADRRNDPLDEKRNWIAGIKGEIRYKFTQICRQRKFRESVYIGTKGHVHGTCEYIKPGYGGKAEIKFYVGHMWYRRVWKNLLENERFQNSSDYIILAATEYRLNIPSVRLWEASVYSIKEKCTRQGWIGQSSIGNQNCCFRQDKMAAVTAAKKLAVEEIHGKLGETS